AGGNRSCAEGSECIGSLIGLCRFRLHALSMRSHASSRSLLNKIQYQTCVTSLEARELTKRRRRDIIEHVVRVLAFGLIRRIDAQSKLMNGGAIGVRNVQAEFPIKPHIQREVKRETFGIRTTNII